MQSRTGRALAAVILAISAALNVCLAHATPVPVPRFAVEKYTLPNGLQVALQVDHKLPLVYVSEWVHAGGRDDFAGRSGLAHVCEHMMFEGSKNAGEYFKAVAKAGAADAAVNANTYYDRT